MLTAPRFRSAFHPPRPASPGRARPFRRSARSRLKRSPGAFPRRRSPPKGRFAPPRSGAALVLLGRHQGRCNRHTHPALRAFPVRATLSSPRKWGPHSAWRLIDGAPRLRGDDRSGAALVLLGRHQGRCNRHTHPALHAFSDRATLSSPRKRGPHSAWRLIDGAPRPRGDDSARCGRNVLRLALPAFAGMTARAAAAMC